MGLYCVKSLCAFSFVGDGFPVPKMCCCLMFFDLFVSKLYRLSAVLKMCSHFMLAVFSV